MARGDQSTELLRKLQAMPMEAKVLLTQARLDEFWTGYNTIGWGNAYISFSGGKDSTVLLDIARKRYPDIPAVFSNTGLEYPEIRKFAQAHDNVETVYPKMRFDEVITKYGYPLIGKDVAEAIYYARKIAPQREKQNLRASEQAHGADWCVPANTYTQTKRTELKGIRQRSGQAGVKPTGQTGEGGAFSNAKEQFGEKSWFNKEKWLPLARDLPIPISHYCCEIVKKRPMNAYKRKYHRYPITATLAEESRLRKMAWLRTGCNSFEGKIQSKPMSFWTEQDVLQYIAKNDLEICSVYGDIVAVDEAGNYYDPRNLLIPGCKLKCTGCERTGCIYCAFGLHLEKGVTRFQRLAWTHPRQYEYCIGGGQWVDNPAYDPAAPKYDGEWENWNPKKIIVPSKKGLGLKIVFDMVNEIYGKDFYRYE